MKPSNKNFGKIVVIAFVLIPGTRVNAQADKSIIKTSIESKQFIFHAQTAMPTSGATRQLTTEYDLRIFPDSLVSNLPFYGRAYSLPYGSTEGGFHFTSTKFEYTATPGKKRGWDITIKPKDVSDFREFDLSLSDDGYGTLQALSNNRQPMAFTGYITEAK